MVQDNIQKKTADSTGSKVDRDKPELAAHLAGIVNTGLHLLLLIRL